MKIISPIVLRISILLAALVVIGVSIIGCATALSTAFSGDLESKIVESDLNRLRKEVSLAQYRRSAVHIQANSAPAELRVKFDGIARNAMSVMDPEGMESVLREAEELGIDMQTSAGLKKLRSLTSDILGERARKRRYDSHQLMLRIAEFDSQLSDAQSRIDLQQQRDLLIKTRAILLSEYPRDLQRALVLDRTNARAIYDLSRFMQDKVGSYDRRIIIRSFERVIELRSGQSEKDADFLNALINLTVLTADIGEDSKARCYSALTLEKHLARSRADYDYLFGSQPDGRVNEPEFRAVTNRVNPSWSVSLADCR